MHAVRRCRRSDRLLSVAAAFGTFLWLAIGGVAIGVVVTWAATVAKNWVSRYFGEETGSQILISLLIPFGAYLLAEQVHCSGILAAVAAGITMSYAEQSGQALPITRIRRSAVWDLVQFAANGIIFVLLGEQLPQLVNGAARLVRETGHREPVWLAVYVVVITLALAGLRFIWVWTSLRFTLFRAHLKGEKPRIPGWRLPRRGLVRRRARYHHPGRRVDIASDDERWIGFPGPRSRDLSRGAVSSSSH